MPKKHPIKAAVQAMRYRNGQSSPWCRRQLRWNHSAVHSSGPLSGVRILDLTRVLAGPFCTQILADYGAKVLKVENPKGGDDTRLWRTVAEKDIWNATDKDISAYFCTINRNKQSITLNLKEEKGREILFRLVENSDVVVDNFVPGKMDSMGIGYERLRQINPSIIHASVSGYGRRGPYAHRAGYDAIAAAEAGMLDITGERDGPPTRPGLGLTDMSTGLYLHGAIIAALYSRKDTGQGQKIDASLFESQVSLLSNVAMSWLNVGERAARWGTEHPSIVPYQAFETENGYLVLGATNNRQFRVLCQLMGESELATDPRFVDNSSRVQNRLELKEIFERILRKKTTQAWLAVLEGSGMPYGPINTIEQVFSHPQTAAGDMVQSLPHEAAISGKIKVLGVPVKFSETKPTIRHSPPSLGEHTDSTLIGMGFSPKEVAALREQGIV
ncbi:hypothetical protein N7522_002076 [Penicillium canescens]|uniref:Uncharacterized protein n=1 Tax=Penicillium canescens TaxID=5083 RepID=A0AAD6I4Z3_PENCN|nr:uncharacterized protein N7446_000043 [Penicillium canescens]KAJ6011721.1 hypothetical protein N7522_002076 [Penicillium canescens]KAJ6030890.1 hypothetical protein N7460_011156 [Penicillium canescens]KAJ6059391.1 hypothetical protein N7444_003030 [Penicillium canescens]KAJ6077107.1 hypothetical protein N7446_000043 [Penicillium canescens]